MTATEFALRTDGVGKRYRKGWALRDCTLALPAGGVIALVGPNGAGKTTLLRLVVGLLAPSTGTVEVLGHDVTASTPQLCPGSGSWPRTTRLQALHRRRDAPLRPGLQLRFDRAGRAPAVQSWHPARPQGRYALRRQQAQCVGSGPAKRPDLLSRQPVATSTRWPGRVPAGLMGAVAEGGVTVLFSPTSCTSWTPSATTCRAYHGRSRSPVTSTPSSPSTGCSSARARPRPRPGRAVVEAVHSDRHTHPAGTRRRDPPRLGGRPSRRAEDLVLAYLRRPSEPSAAVRSGVAA